MLTKVQNNSDVSHDSAAVIPAAVLENLATRLRNSGLYLLMFRSDGSLAFQDSAADPFYRRYILPRFQVPGSIDSELYHSLCNLSADSPITIWKSIPGTIVAVLPYIQKRQVGGTLVIVGKCQAFSLDEDVLRICSQIGLDGTWLQQQAEQLPGYGEQAVQRQAQLLHDMLRDQVRLASLENELESLSGQLANTYEELSLIYQISGGMKINRGASEFFKQACFDVREVMNVAGMGVAFCGEGSLNYEPALYGSLRIPQARLTQLGNELVAILRERNSPLLVHDLAANSIFPWMAEYAHQILAVPLQRQDQVLGCIFALDKVNGDFDSADSKLLNSIANESAIYLENSLLFEDAHSLMMGLLHGLTGAVDAKDAYTCGHTERVALLSRHLAQRVGLSDPEVERVYMAGLLHDVGKIGIPESVLQKAGRLTTEEFEVMKKHPEIGARILRDIRQLQDVVPGVLHHHERYDGKGYPFGLAGEDIPLIGRIIGLADGFDAMTSNRTYRNALPLEVALTEIRRCAGTQFDPALAEEFLSIGLEKFRELMRENRERSKKLVDLQKTLRRG